MSKMEDGGPAFPFEERNDDGSHYHSRPGMSLREYFAGLAMQAVIGGALSTGMSDVKYANVADGAVKFADALIAELAKGGDE